MNRLFFLNNLYICISLCLKYNFFSPLYLKEIHSFIINDLFSIRNSAHFLHFSPCRHRVTSVELRIPMRQDKNVGHDRTI